VKEMREIISADCARITRMSMAEGLIKKEWQHSIDVT